MALGNTMLKDEIIEMADKADAEADNVLNMKGEYHPNWHQVRDEIFAKLVAEKEREACAKLCEKEANNPDEREDTPWVACAQYLANNIRARGQEC